MNNRNLSWLAATTLWMINPVFSGCDSNTENEFQFEEAELLDLLDELNAQSWETTFDGEPSTVTVDFSQLMDGSADDEPTPEDDHASLWMMEIGSADACSSRNFLAEAEACIDVSSLPIEGTVTITSDLDIEAEPQVFTVSGSIDVFGTVLNNADVWVNSDDIQLNWTGRFDDSSVFEEFSLSYVE